MTTAFEVILTEVMFEIIGFLVCILVLVPHLTDRLYFTVPNSNNAQKFLGISKRKYFYKCFNNKTKIR